MFDILYYYAVKGKDINIKKMLRQCYKRNLFKLRLGAKEFKIGLRLSMPVSLLRHWCHFFKCIFYLYYKINGRVVAVTFFKNV